MQEQINLQAHIQYDNRKIVFRGETDLPEGTILEASKMEYPIGTEPFSVEVGAADPLKETKAAEKAEVAKEGTFLVVLKRDPQKRYQISLQFRPELQPVPIKEIYGDTGDSIGASEGLFNYEDNGTEYTGIALFAPLNTIDDAGFWMGRLEMRPNQKDARPY
ncbi:hypothetical protein [Rossellomorea aquimaris]|uniref:hypothetical protein n=1 Tax=Rossellomorea aquimaris TaxID=189382 RepID=UPI00114D3F44|nr:hypothetical protein [Rossellomorea aquimaris]